MTIQHSSRLLLAWFWLLAWSFFHTQGDCLLTGLFILPVIFCIAAGMLESALLHRRALVGMYLHPQGWLYRLLRGGFVMVIWQILKALIFSALLLVQVLSWTLWEWVLLGIDALILWYMYEWIRRRIAQQIRPGFDAMLARRSLITLNTVLFTGLITLGNWYTPQTDYQSLNLSQVMYYGANQAETGCSGLAVLVRSVATADAVGWWLAQTWLTRPELYLLAPLGWLIFLISSAAFMWGYTHLLLGTLVSPLTLFTYLDQHSDDRTGDNRT